MPGWAGAHGFGAAYNLPVPLALYNWGAAATLVVSFVLVGLFWSRSGGPREDSGPVSRARVPVRRAGWLIPVLRTLSLFLLFLCIATGFLGSVDPLRNFAPVFFWIIFLLLFTYLVAVIGDAWAVLNPFRTLADAVAALVSRGRRDGFFPYPAWLADWPALLFYLAFIWFELFSHRTPQSLAIFLSGYAVLNIAGVLLIGSRNWFRHCEFFSVFFRLVATMAPVEYCCEAGRRHLRFRWPFAGLIQQRPGHLSTVVFVLAMISTTAFDGLQATQWWVGLFWRDPSGIFTELAGASPMRMMHTLMPVYMAWETFWLFASPFLYLALYLAAVWLMKRITRSPRPLRMLALDFSYSLLPIALVYNMTHYWTLITMHGMKILSVVSDPFGWRWDLFGTAMHFRAPILPDMGLVWHSQVGLILLGHVVSVCVAHQVALRTWPSRSTALLSQVPMLLMMVGFTVFGLWVLAQPLTAVLPR